MGFWARQGREEAAVLALALSLAAVASSSIAADWPHWRGPARNAITPESSGWPSGWPPKRLWGRNVGKGCTSPIIVGGKLYVMGWTGGSRRGRGTDFLYCFDARSGRELWKQSYPSPYHGRVRAGDLGAYGGPSSTPSYDRSTGYLYTISNDGDLRCWDAKQRGRPVWAKNLYDDYKAPQRPYVGGGRRDYGYPTSALIRGGLVMVEVGAAQGTVMAFDKKTGRRRWTSQYNRAAGHTGGLAPMKVAGKDCLAVLTLHNLVVMRIDKGHEGRTIATCKWQTEFACNVPTPAVAGNRVIVASGYNHKAATMFEVSLRGARKGWTSKRHTVASSPVIYRDRVFMVNRALQCVDLATGKLKWRGGDFGNGSCLVAAADNKVIAFGSRRVVLLEALAEEYRELSRLDRIVRGTCYPHIALSDGILCCKDRDGNMACFSVRPVPDTTPPGLASVFAGGDPTKLTVYFSEPVEKASAEAVGNYALDQHVKVLAARLGREQSSVTLNTTALKEDVTYTLTVNNVKDCAKPPNTIPRNTRVSLRFTPSRRATGGLVALYSLEEGRGTIVNDVSGNGRPLNLRLRDGSAARWVPGGLAIRSRATVGSAGPATKIIEACRKTNEITIEAWIKPANTRQGGPARIVSLSHDPYKRNFTLGQERGNYNVRLRTTRTGENGMNPSLSSKSGVTDRLSHVVYTRNRSGKARVYVDGQVKGSGAITGDLGNWDGGFRLALANELTSDRPWLGELHLVAIYSRALEPAEVVQNHRAGPEGKTPRR